jgi:hypothetical protein
MPAAPSLLIVPYRSKTGKLYSQIPTSGAGDFTVTRDTTATRFNSAGLIESVASGIPRLDYYTSGGTAGCPALLVEPAATNICLQSEAFNTTWTRVSGGTGLLPAITANAVVAPDGTTTADTVVFNRGSATSGNANFSQLEQVINFPTSGTYTFGVYAKATAAGDVGKQFYIRTRSTLVSGSLTSSWVRYTSTETGLSSGNNTIYIGNRGGFTADQTVSVDLWGAQLETGSVATSYIPTTTGTGSRSADVISVSGAVSGSIGQTEGTIYVEGVITNYADAAASFITISDNTINNRLEIRKGSPGSIIFERESATQSASTSINATGQSNGVFKMAVAYKSGDTAFFINGVQVATTNAATFTMNTLTHIYLGNNASGTARRLNDRIRAVALYTTRLTNTELAALTA